MISTRRFALAGLIGIGSFLQACDGGPTGPNTGSLTVNIANIPSDVAAPVTVQGAVGTAPVTVGATRTLADLAPGTYTVTAGKAVGAKASYNASVASQVVEVVKGTTPATVTVAYTLATGIANVTITGLPAGTEASVTVFNNSGFFKNLKTSGEVGNLEPGTYTVQTDPITADEVYAAVTAQATFNVTASTTPVQVQAGYIATTGSIQFSSTGLPAGAVAFWDVTGPNNFQATVKSTDALILPRLVPGTYTVSARNLDFGSDTYGAAAQSVNVAVTAGVKAPAAFAYVTRPPTLNLTVEGAYITQSTQRFDGSIPLVAQRPGFLRVFLKANELNSATPKVRARIYRNGQLVQTSTLNAPTASVGTTVSERNTSDSWGLSLGAELMTGALSVLVDVDPDNTVREVNENDNVYPASGTPRAFEVRAVPVVELRFVPIVTAVNSLTGNVNEGRIPELTSLAQRMYPIGLMSSDVRAAFTTSAPVLTSNGGDVWVQIINELNAVRVAEGTLRHYVGILKAPYTSGIAGIGFIPGKTVLSWDYPGAASTVAHELGHNWGRSHAPCGGPAGPDPLYPYPNARIGVYGFDMLSGAVQDIERRDVMSYCSPEWVSDYTYEGILNFRGSTAASVSSATQSSLVVWGRIEGSTLTLEPAFLADTKPSLPARGGRYRVEGFDANGAQVFSMSFEGERVAEEGVTDSRHFGFAIPMSAATAARIVSMRLSGDGREVRSTASAQGSPTVTAQAIATDKVRLTWNAAQSPMLVVRDPDTREILSFARGGTTTVTTRKRVLDVAASNRVTSTRLQIQARN